MRRSSSSPASDSATASVARAAVPAKPAEPGRVVSPFSLTGVQRKVKVGAPGDSAEHEANRVADQVANGSSAKPTISRLQLMQRKPAGTEDAAQKKEESAPAEVHRSATEGGHEDAASVHRAELPDAGHEAATQRRCCEPQQAEPRPSGTASVYCKPLHGQQSTSENELNHSVRRKAPSDAKASGDLDAAATHAISTKDAGAPLRPYLLQKLESRMGADLGGVRVHEGPAAHASAAALQARAFTHKGDIWLGKGESQDNLNLMAHEATHVVQQGAAPGTVAQETRPAQTPVMVATGEAGATAVGAIAAGAAATGADVAVPGAAAPDVAGSVTADSGAAASRGAASGKAAGGGGAESPGAAAAAAGGAAIAKPAKPGAAAGKATGGGGASAGAGDDAGGAAQDGAAKKGAKSAQNDPAFLAVVKNVKGAAAHQKAHASAGTKVAAAHAAVASPANEVPSKAAAKQTDEIDQEQPKPFNRAAFKAALLKKIEDTAPKTLKAADEFKTSNNLDTVKSDLNSQVASDKKESQGALAVKVAATPDSSGIEPLTAAPLTPEEAGAPPQVAAAGAAPKRAGDEEISLQSGPRELDRQMADASVTEEQLQDSNEPTFTGALAQKKDVEKQSVAAPQAFRTQEQGMLHAAQAEAQGITTKDANAMHGIKIGATGSVTQQQAQAKAQEEAERQRIFGEVERLYQDTKTKVEARLAQLDTDVNTAFDKGATAAQKGFEDYVDVHMRAYKKERYDGIGGGLLWAKDKLFGLPDDVNAFYLEGHDYYIADMDALIDQIAATVETGLNDAKGLVAAGKAAIQTFIAGLPQSSQKVGKQAASGIESRFEALETSITDKQDQLIDSLAKKYNDSLQAVNSRIDEMKEENSGLVHKVAGAIKGVIQAIAHLKDLLLNVLSRAAAAIGLIIAHPIKFLEHLVDAGMRGFNNFRKNIVEHLKNGFMEWLFGAVAKAGIELPKTFDLSGILSLVLQLLGLTYANIRARAVNILGEKIVKGLETTAEVFKVLITKGPAGLWEFIKDKLAGLLDTVIDSIKTFIMEKVIIAGVTWLIGLLNPASAFVKACKAIYDIVMFFVEHGSQILDLVNAIVDSITAIAGGKIDQAADFIEKSLARAIPVIIGFLASLLGVGGISEKIKEVIDKIREPINEAIDWVINKAVGLAKGIGGALGLGGKPDERTEKEKEADLDKAIAEAQALQQAPNATEDQVRKGLPAIKKKYRMISLDLVVDSEEGSEETVHIAGQINPKKSTQKSKMEKFADTIEGLAGTYTDLLSKGKKGDKVTPDHEPQHALMSYVSDLDTRRFVGFQKPFSGTNLAGYTKGEGICLNMSQSRHYETKTYGKSAAPAIETIRTDLGRLAVNTPVEKVRDTVTKVVKSELEADQKVVVGIYGRANLSDETRKRVNEGIPKVTAMNEKWWQ